MVRNSEAVVAQEDCETARARALEEVGTAALRRMEARGSVGKAPTVVALIPS